MDDLDGLGDIGQIHSVLRGDFQLIIGYGEEHPGTWAGAWWDNEPTVRMVAAFSGDGARHDAALRSRLRHPDRLVVESRPLSLAELRRVREEIESVLDERQAQTGRPVLTSMGGAKGVIHVHLRADQENLASELAARYGSVIELRVGNFPFPDRWSRQPRPPAGPEPGEQTFEGLEVSVEVDQPVIEAGDDGDGWLALRNSGSGRIGPLDTGQPLVGSLLNASLEIVGGYSGWTAGTGLGVDLAPGQSARIPVIYGTASTVEDLGYALPPGVYWLQVQIRFRPAADGPGANVLTAPLTQITIIPRVMPHRDARPS